MKMRIFVLLLFLLSLAIAFAGGPVKSPSSSDVVVTATAWTAITSTVSTLQEALNAIDTAFGGLGTMSTEAATNYVATSTFTAHTDNSSNPHSVTYAQLSDKPAFGTMASETATNYVATSTLTAHESGTSTHGKATIAGMEDIPNNASFSFTDLSDAPPLEGNAHRVLTVGTDTNEIYWSPNFLDLNGGDATHTANLDVQSLTVNGEDILGDISAALTAILGE